MSAKTATMAVYESRTIPMHWIVAPDPLPRGMIACQAVANNAAHQPIKRLHVATVSLTKTRLLPAGERERIIEAAVIAEDAYLAGLMEAYDALRTSDEVATQLGVAASTVRKHAARHDIGRLFGRDRLFRPEDVERLRREIGRPPGPRPSMTCEE